MDQMNVSMTDHLASYVRKKVKSGRYNNASEVVRDAVRRMEKQEAREARLAQPAAEAHARGFGGRAVRVHPTAGAEAVGSGQGC